MNPNPQAPRRRQQTQNKIKALRQERIQRQRFHEPLTGKQARHIAHAAAAAEFRPTERQIASQIRGSNKREHEISGWYNQLGSDYATQAQQAADAFKAAEQATTQRLAEAAQRGQSTLQGLQAADQSFAKLTGAPTNASGLGTSAQAAQAAEHQRVTLNAPNSTQQAAYIASIGPQLASAHLAGIKAHGENQANRQKMQQDLQAAKRERGNAYVKALEALREQEQKNAIERGTLHLSQRKTSNEVAEGRRAAAEGALERGEKAQEREEERRQHEIENRQEGHKIRIEQEEANTNKKNGGLTPHERKEAHEAKTNALGFVRSFIHANGMPKTAKEWAGLEVITGKQGGISQTDAAWAVKRIHQHFASKNQNNSGIVPNTGW